MQEIMMKGDVIQSTSRMGSGNRKATNEAAVATSHTCKTHNEALLFGWKSVKDVLPSPLQGGRLVPCAIGLVEMRNVWH